LFTGERVGAICQLSVSDIYAENGSVLDTITFAGITRKGSKHGSAATRQVPIHPDLLHHLERYQPSDDGYLFPSRGKSGHITSRAVDKYWRSILNDYGFSGYSTHSSRRWVINSLRKAGISIVTIGETMGMAVSTVRHYLDNDPAEVSRAIATLST
jgi:integrase/recombinase XerD